MTSAAAQPVPSTPPSGAPSVEQLNGALEQLIPRAWQMGARFTVLEPGHVEASVPFAGNANHFGVVYAGVTFTVAELLGGAIHASTFAPGSHFPVVKALTIEFTAPGTSDLTAVARLADDEVARLREAAVPGAKVPFVLHTDVYGEDGTLVARTRGDYQLRPLG